MTEPQIARRAFALLLAGLFAACGGDAPEAGGETEQPPAEGAVLESADFVGIEEANVTFNLHWVPGPVNRDASRLAPPVNEIQQVTTIEGEDFDRVIFHLGEGDVPGYSISWNEEPVTDCVSSQPVTLVGDHKLRVQLTSVTAVPDALRPQDPRYDNLRSLAVSCRREEGMLEWHFGANQHAQLRVIEMRSPRRLVVDVKHEAAPGH